MAFYISTCAARFNTSCSMPPLGPAGPVHRLSTAGALWATILMAKERSRPRLTLCAFVRLVDAPPPGPVRSSSIYRKESGNGTSTWDSSARRGYERCVGHSHRAGRNVIEPWWTSS